MEARENALRADMRRNQQNENLNSAAERQGKRMAEREMNGQLNAAELHHHATDPFLNENAGHFLEGGRIRRDAYKGSTREDRERVRDSIFAQADELQAARNATTHEDKAFDRETE